MRQVNMKRLNKTRTAYIISLEGKTDFEYNLEGEILVFDNYDQIAEYANVNDIDFATVNVYPVEVEDIPLDLSDADEVEF